MAKKIAVIVGSLRKGSLNRQIANQLIHVAPKTLQLSLTEISQLPIYNPDLDEGKDIPASWTQLRHDIKTSDGVLFVTPEYNRSIPGVLKNVIDIGSRPYGQSAWDGLPGAIVSASPGAIGGFGANHHLRQALVFLNVPCLQQPEMYLGGAANFFDADGNLTNEDTKKFLSKFMEVFAEWVLTHSKK
jgi:chromate reductase